MPPELRPLFPSAELEALSIWASDAISSQQPIAARQVLARIGADTTGKLTRTQLIACANTLAAIGVGLAPDPRFSLRLPSMDEPLVLFELEDASELPEASLAFQAALIGLALAVFVAHADGVIRPDEVAALERLYKALGVDPALVYADLHAGGADGPVPVRPAQPSGPGEALSAEPVAPRAALDFARISEIRYNTAQVSSLLGQIFAGEEEAAPQTAMARPVVLEGLDPAAAGLVMDLIQTGRLTEAAYTALAHAHGLMPEGALETINEWAFERWDEALIEVWDDYEVSDNVTALIRDQLHKGEQYVEA